MAKLAVEEGIVEVNQDDTKQKMSNILPIEWDSKMSQVNKMSSKPLEVPLELFNENSHKIEQLFVPLSIYRKYSSALKMHKK